MIIKNTFFIKTYGCQMNFSDSELVINILKNNKYKCLDNIKLANIIIFNICTIRSKIDKKIKNIINNIKYIKNRILCIIGCISLKMRNFFINNEKINIIISPDLYLQLPFLIKRYILFKNKKITNFNFLSNEMYNNIYSYKRFNKVSAYITIIRGCDNMCTFCVVPFTRGREKSRSLKSILKECKYLYINNYKEIILLGQNVDSYFWYGEKDYKKNYFLYKKKKKKIKFYNLLKIIAIKFPSMRIRFITSNPQDMSMKVIKVMKKYDNICKYIHLPFQSGSDKILKLMNRKYTKKQYIKLIKNIKKKIPNCAITYDVITGFPNETNKDHLETINLIKKIKFDYGYMFIYSERLGTYSQRKYKDNIPLLLKKKRLNEIINLQSKYSLYNMKKYVNTYQKILIEGYSKKDKNYLYGRNSQNVIVIVDNIYKLGDIVKVFIYGCTKTVLLSFKKKC
ncbi:MAG: MiaB/RimO family radical SAM methylthiotransferase [Candidatus Shikimatogenerans sp. Tduv]|uniref:tRNA-2-methylthio-N(6)-dimethylallyladenosine synthase n=1 Tax=Candidatus Shikimatogenerans sp. Tduv TaxID=3158567 RepID=A0AAU7QU15_9FLAO